MRPASYGYEIRWSVGFSTLEITAGSLPVVGGFTNGHQEDQRLPITRVSCTLRVHFSIQTLAQVIQRLAKGCSSGSIQCRRAELPRLRQGHDLAGIAFERYDAHVRRFKGVGVAFQRGLQILETVVDSLNGCSTHGA